jgi:GntR family transcriptional repressor for pyruvate dehydrogenase complex
VVSAESIWSPVRKVRTHEQVVAQIQDKILDGELRVGAKLPSERDLVEALGVSRSSVREALRALEAMGIIDAQGGSGRDSGSVISGRSTEALGTLLRLHVALAGIALEDLIDVRVQLERHAAEGAAMHRGAEDVARLRTLVESMQPSRVSSSEFNELDTEFHVSIARSSGNGLAATLMQALRDAVKAEMMRAFTAIDDWRNVGERLVAEHSGIVDAIEARRPAEAADLVEAHIRTFYRDQVAGRPAGSNRR